MKKILFFLGVLFCNSLSVFAAMPSDTVQVENTIAVQKTDSLSNAFLSYRLRELYLSAIESEYDRVYDFVSSDAIVASRGGKYMIVNIYTGAEQMISRYDDTEYEGHRNYKDDDSEEISDFPYLDYMRHSGR